MINQILNKKNYRTLIKLLRGYQGDDDQPFEKQKSSYLKANTMVRYFYMIMFFWTTNLYFFSWEEWNQLAGLPQPLWPVKWLGLVPFLPGLNSLVIFAMTATLLAALFPHNRFLRILSFIAVLQSFAIPNSFGKINHDMHLWVSAGFFFIFLPTGRVESITKRQQYLTAFWGTQFLVLSFYTSSGLWKSAGAVIQFFMGEIHAFHPLGLSSHVANRLIQTNFESILGSYIIDFPMIGWPLFIGAILLEVFSFIIAFRPKLHYFWGLNLILLHVGIWLTLHVPFIPNILFLMIFFVNSPFHPEKLTLKDMVFSLPILGDGIVFFMKQFKQATHQSGKQQETQPVLQPVFQTQPTQRPSCIHCRTAINMPGQTMCANCEARFGTANSFPDHPTILSQAQRQQINYSST